jgi:hypothetical protein
VIACLKHPMFAAAAWRQRVRLLRAEAQSDDGKKDMEP